MEYIKQHLRKNTISVCITRILAIHLVVALFMSCSGMTVLAQEVGKTVAESREAYIESTEASLEEESVSSAEEELEEEESSVFSEEQFPEEESPEASDENPISDEEASSVDSEDEVSEEAEDETDFSKEESCEEENVSEKLYIEGDFGETVHWVIDTNGNMTISQDEDVAYEYFDKVYYEDAPWAEYISIIKSVHINANCLYQETDGSVWSAYSIGSSMSQLDCCGVEKISFGDKFDATYFTAMVEDFSGFQYIKEIDFGNSLTENMTTMTYMFADCSFLTHIEAPVHLEHDVFLPDTCDGLKWYRMDTLEEIECLPKGLEQSVLLQKYDNLTAVNPTKVILNKTVHSMECEQTYLLLATFEPSNVTNQQLEWSSADASIASVNENGLVTAHKIGTTTITAKSRANKNIKATCKISVVQMATEMKVRLEKDINESGEYVLTLGNALAPIVTFYNGDTWPEVTYSVSNDTAAIENDKIVGKKAGSGILTATAKNGENYGPSASLRYRVYTEEVSEITLNENKVILDAQSAKNSFRLEARITNHESAFAKVEFSANKPGIVRIEEHGDNTATVSPINGSKGSVVVTAKATDGSGKSASCTFISGTLVETITIHSNLETDVEKINLLGEGKTSKLTAGVLPSNATDKTIEWTSSDEAVVKVDTKGGITAVSPGVAIIQANAKDGSGVSGMCAIRVTRPATGMELSLSGGSDGKVALFSPEEGCVFNVIATLKGSDGETEGVLQEVNYSLSGSGAKNVVCLRGGYFIANAPGDITVTVTSKDGSKLKRNMKIRIEQHVYAFDVQAPKNTGKYTGASGEECWIVYKGTKDVTLTPVVTYNENSKTNPADKDYKNYKIILGESAETSFSVNQKGTGFVVGKNTAPGIYAVTFLNEDSNISKTVYIDVVAVSETCIRDVAITLPSNVASENGSCCIAEGSKVKLTGVLNGGEKIKGHTLEWNVNAKESNAGNAVVSSAGVLDLTKAEEGDCYSVSLTVSKGEESKISEELEIKVTKKTEVSALQLVLAEDEEEVLPGSFNVQYVHNEKLFKVAEQEGVANRYSVSGGKSGVLTLEEKEDGYIVRAEATGTAKITITALDGSNIKKVLSVKVVAADNPVNKVSVTGKTYSIEPGKPIAIPYEVSAKKGEVTDARVEWTSSNESLLKVSLGDVEDCATSCITTNTKGYLTLFSVSGMTGKVTLTGKALDGSKKSVKVTVNVVSDAKKAVTYSISLQTPAKTPNGGVPGLALVTHGKSVKLSANVFPNKAKNKNILYSIAGVNADGEEGLTQAELKQMGITVKKGVVTVSKKSTYTGYVKVTATLDYMTLGANEHKAITASKMLYIQPPVKKVEIVDADGKTIKTAQAGAGEKLFLDKKVTGAGTLTYANVLWSVSNSGIASVDQNGCVKIKADAKTGKKVKVTATALDSSKKKAVVTIVTVQGKPGLADPEEPVDPVDPTEPVEVISVTLEKEAETLSLYEQLTLKATVLPANATDKTICWESGDATIVRVSKGGTILAVSPGTATITAKTTNGKSADCVVTVQEKVHQTDSTNKLKPTNPELIFNAPYLSTYYFNPKPSVYEEIKIPLYITDYEQSEYLNNNTTGKLDLIYEVDGEKKTLTDLPLGDYTLNIGKLSKGLHTFSVQVLDKRTGVKSHELYNELWVVDPDEYAISEEDTYYMTEQDLASYRICNNDSTDAEDLIHTRDGLTKLFADKQAEGYRKIVLLKGIYRINGEDARDNCITIPSYFTVDMNGSTFKLNTISVETAGCIVLMNNAIDARLENGILEGDRYERQELNLERDGLGEGINTVLIRSGKYCSLNNLTIKNTTGHTIWSLPDMDVGLQRKLTGYTRTAIIDGKEVQCENYSTSSMMDLSDYINWDVNEDYFYIGFPAGYRGIRTKSAIVYVSFYDKNRSFLETVTACQFRKILIPGNAKYARVTLHDNNISEDQTQEGVYIYPRRLGDYHEIKNIAFENTRTCALAPTTCSNLLVEGVTYTNCGDSITPLPVDFEDGWDETQDVYYRNNEVILNAEHTTGTIVDNAGFNHVYENCINHQLTINGRLTGCVVRNTNDVRNTVRFDLGNKICNSYARVYDNNCGAINYIVKDENGAAVADLSVLDEAEIAKLVNVTVKNCTIQNGTDAGSTHCFGYAEKVTYDNCTFTSFAGRNAVFHNCTIQPASYMNNKLYFYDCTFKALDGSEKITLNLNAPRDSERIFENCKFEGKVAIGTENFHTGIFRNCEFEDVEFITAVDSLDGTILFENCKINSSAENVIYTGPFAGNIDYINVQFKDCEITHTGANLVGFFSMPSKNSQILFENCKINKKTGALVKWLTNYSRPQNVDKISVDVIFRNTECNETLEIDNTVDEQYARIIFE